MQQVDQTRRPTRKRAGRGVTLGGQTGRRRRRRKVMESLNRWHCDRDEEAAAPRPKLKRIDRQSRERWHPSTQCDAMQQFVHVCYRIENIYRIESTMCNRDVRFVSSVKSGI